MLKNQAEPRRHHLLTILCQVVASASIAAVYFALRTSRQTADSLSYAAAIRDGQPLLNPHHIGFQPIVRSVRAALGQVGVEVDAIVAAQVHNCAWAGIAVVAMFATLRNIGLATRFAILGAAGLATSTGFWHYATLVEVYVPSLACLLMATALLTRTHSARRRIVDCSVALLWVMAVCYHQSAVLFVLPLAAFVATGNMGASLHRWAWISALAGVITLLVYSAGMLAVDVEFSARGFVEFCLEYAHRSTPGWGDADNVSLQGVRFLMFSQARAVASLSMTDRYSMGSYAFATAMLLAVCAAIARSVCGRSGPTERRAALGFGFWILAWYGFALWWLPTEPEYTIATLAPFFGASTIAIAKLAANRRWLTIAAALGVLALATWNFCTRVLPTRDGPGREWERTQSIYAARDRDVVFLVRHITRMHLLYSFDVPLTNSTLAGEQFFSLYDNGVSQDRDAFDERGARIVTADLIAPDYSVHGFSGDTYPEGWRRVIHWVFDVREDSHASFELVRGPNGPVCFLIDSTERIPGDLRSLGPLLDKALGSSEFTERLR